jgi:hypothetical protein
VNIYNCFPNENVTARKIEERLMAELQTDVSLRVDPIGPDSWTVSGLRAVMYFPSRPANGELLTKKVICKVGSSMCRIGTYLYVLIQLAQILGLYQAVANCIYQF